MTDVIDVDYVINEPSEQDRPRKRRIIVEEEPLAYTEVRPQVNPDALIVTAGAAVFAWGFAELWKYLDRLEEEEENHGRRRRKRLR